MFWCGEQKVNPVGPTVEDLLKYLYNVSVYKSYSVVNTHKSAILQTVQFFDKKWKHSNTTLLISKFMKGIFNRNPYEGCYQ